MKKVLGKMVLALIFTWCVLLSACVNEKEGLMKQEEMNIVVNRDIYSFGENVTGINEEVGGIPGNLINEGLVCESDGCIYYAVDNCLYKINEINDEENKQLLSIENGECREVCVIDDYVYYISSSQIKRIHKKGGSPVLLSDIPALYMQVTRDKIYFACNGIYSMNTDGSELKLLTKEGLDDEASFDLIWLNLYKDYVMYVSTEEHMTLYAVKKDASEVYRLMEHVNFPVVAGDSIYYLDGEGILSEYNILTCKKQSITDSFQVRPILLESQIYFTDYCGIYCLDIKTNEKERVYPNQDLIEDENLEDCIDLFWVTKDYIFFNGYSEEGNRNREINYVNRNTEKSGVLK